MFGLLSVWAREALTDIQPGWHMRSCEASYGDGQGKMAAGVFEGQYVWHPAADDRRLASVCVDVRAGRYLSAHESLAESRGDFDPFLDVLHRCGANSLV